MYHILIKKANFPIFNAVNLAESLLTGEMTNYAIGLIIRKFDKSVS